jgi:spermidine/putrescine transport system substrate-binding protein
VKRDSEPPALTRRRFLELSGGALAAAGLGSLLSGCGTSSSTASGPPLPRPNHPVTWPISTSNPVIASNLEPEKGATLQLYNWVAYINQSVVDSFAKKHGCKVAITTFNTMEEAISKLQTTQLPFDVFFPTVDVIGQLVEAQLVRPLNHSYIPNITQAWTAFQNPFYDQGWRYTTPYTIYTTGIAWRKDLVSENPYNMANGYAMPWNGKYKGKVAILDDYRESLSLGLMKDGNYDLNTGNPKQLAKSFANLEALRHLTNVQVDNNDYQYVPNGRTWIHHAWSGDMAAAASYMPSGVPVSVVGYWFPRNGLGPIANDTMVVLKGGHNPVLAHMFLNYMLEFHNVVENISFNGYMQPISGVTPQLLVQEQILPPTLTSTVVLESDFSKGVMQLELPPTVDALWQHLWSQFGAGL